MAAHSINDGAMMGGDGGIASLNDAIEAVGADSSVIDDDVAPLSSSSAATAAAMPVEQQEGNISPSLKKRRKQTTDDGNINRNNNALAEDGDNADELDDRKPAAKPQPTAAAAAHESMMDAGDFKIMADPTTASAKRKRNNDNADGSGNRTLPIAPSLDEYLKAGGHSKYSPRPEWYHHFSKNYTNSNNGGSGSAATAFASSSVIDPSSAAAAARAGVQFLAQTAERGARAAFEPLRMGVDGPLFGGNDYYAGRNDNNGYGQFPRVRPPLMPLGLSPAAAAAWSESRRISEGRIAAYAAGIDEREAARFGVRAADNGGDNALNDGNDDVREDIGIHRDDAVAIAIHRDIDSDATEPHNNNNNAASGLLARDNHGRAPHPLREENNEGTNRQQQLQPVAQQQQREVTRRGNNDRDAETEFFRAEEEFLRANEEAEAVAPHRWILPAFGTNRPREAAAAAAAVRRDQPVFDANRAREDGGDIAAFRGARPAFGIYSLPQRDQPGGGRQLSPRMRRQIQAGGNAFYNNIAAPEVVAAGGGSPEHRSGGSGSKASPSASFSPGGKKVAVFGFECDSALHLAIKQRATEAAMDLIGAGACINFPNAKGITPLMIASQEGTLEVVRALLNNGALPNATTIRGSTALIQACHFGKLPVVEELLRHGASIDQANLKNTTALMRASQEGHEGVVRLLLARNASVNRRNDERMTALMLSSQRGHSSIVEMLVKSGAQVDAKTAQDSTSLMLACKRKHLNVAKILVASGTELKLKDCKNRTVLETATRRGNDAFAEILTDAAQVRLMQADSRKERNFSMVRVWKLLQSERAMIRLGGMDMPIHNVTGNLGSTTLMQHANNSKRALMQSMTLPAPLIELISSFIPPPLIWEKRLMLLTSRSHVDPDSAVYNALDLIDEVLEVGGMIEAFDAAGIDPPSDFESWSAYKVWCGKCDVILSRCGNVDVTNIFAQESASMEVVELEGSMSGNSLRLVEASQNQRRSCNYLSVLAHAPSSIVATLSAHPYDMPNTLFQKLKACHDIQSVVRRLNNGGIHFETSIANELVVIARMAVMWCESRPMY